MSNELGRLTHGNKFGIKSTDTIDFITKEEVPIGNKITYPNFVYNYRPLKPKPHKIQWVPAGSLIETKSSFGAKFMSRDLKDFFLAIPMYNAKFMNIHYKYIPQDNREQYNLDAKLAQNGYICLKI